MPRASPSALLRIACADNRDYAERKKEEANNTTVPCPSDIAQSSDSAARKARSSALASIPAPFKGAATGLPPLARVDGLEPQMLSDPTAGRQAIFLGATEPRAARPERRCREELHLRPSLRLLVKIIDVVPNAGGDDVRNEPKRPDANRRMQRQDFAFNLSPTGVSATQWEYEWGVLKPALHTAAPSLPRAFARRRLVTWRGRAEPWFCAPSLVHQRAAHSLISS